MEITRGASPIGAQELRVDAYGNSASTFPIDGLPTQKLLTTTGISSFVNHNLDYSLTPTDIYYKATNVYEIHTILVSISDASKFTQSGFGGLSALTHGINFWVSLDDNVTKIPLLNDIHFKENKDWFYVSHDVLLTQFDGLADTLSILICISKCYGTPLLLKTGHIFGTTLNDDFTGLTALTFQTRGILYDYDAYS